MREVAFSIPISGVVRINEGRVAITVNKADTEIRFETEKGPSKRITFELGMTMFDIVLDAARNVIRRKGVNRFTAAELYHQSLERYPELKRNSFAAHVIASAPNHSSYRHYTAKRDFLYYMNRGLYRLVDEYVSEPSANVMTVENR